MSRIELRNVTKRFGDTVVLADVDLTIPSSAIVAVLGPSGSGKTTLLRLIAGLERIDAGRVTIGERTVDDGRRTMRPRDRGVGYVPQDGALFPHLTVAKNVGFGLARNLGATVDELLDLVGLRDLAGRYPHELSGGQQQRVAIARALAIRPHVVLLDEPFGALDATLRGALRRDVARILTATGTTTVLVTHDQDEALTLASHLAILDDHRVIACADARSLYRDPPDLGIATAIGEANVLSAMLHDAGSARSALGALTVVLRERVSNGECCRVLIRPEQLELTHAAGVGVEATVIDIDYHGHDALVRLAVGGPDSITLVARTPGSLTLTQGDRVRVSVRGVVPGWSERAGA